MRVTVDDSEVRRAIKHLKRRIPAAAKEASLAATKKFGELLLKRVRNMIPDKGGWYDIYRSSIELNETKEGHWELTTSLQEISPAKIPADLSLITFTHNHAASTNPVATNVVTLLISRGYWTLDTIPAIYGGLPAHMKVTPASLHEVEHFRRLRLAERKKLGHDIRALNGNVLPFDASPPKISGRVVADVPFLALRLEYGYGGFPKTPIWSRIDMEGKIISKSRAVEDVAHNTFAARWWQEK